VIHGNATFFPEPTAHVGFPEKSTDLKAIVAGVITAVLFIGICATLFSVPAIGPVIIAALMGSLAAATAKAIFFSVSIGAGVIVGLVVQWLVHRNTARTQVPAQPIDAGPLEADAHISKETSTDSMDNASSAETQDAQISDGTDDNADVISNSSTITHTDDGFNAEFQEITPTYVTSDEAIMESDQLKDFKSYKGDRQEALEARRHVLDMRVPRISRSAFGSQAASELLREKGCTGAITLRKFENGRRIVSKKFHDGESMHFFVTVERNRYNMRMVGMPDGQSFAQDVASRNIAAFGVAKSMAQLGNAPDTVPVVQSWAVVDDEEINANVSIELYMECAPGKAVAEHTIQQIPGRLNLRQMAEFARQCTWLHLNNYLVHQTDRHSENVFVKFTENNCTVKGIDNDTCLPERGGAVSPIGIRTDHGPVLYPEHIDREMYNAIMAVTIDHLSQIMQSSGRNPRVNPFKRELETAWKVAEQLKIVAEKLKAGGHVLETREAWADEEVLASMTDRNSYYGKFLPDLMKDKVTNEEI
jgi:hypothetical protein